VERIETFERYLSILGVDADIVREAIAGIPLTADIYS
jgi:hypothetical protein